MTYFHQHKQEFYFQSLLLFSTGGILFVITFYFSDLLIYWMANPLITLLDSTHFIITDIKELFSLKLSIAILISSIMIFILFLGQSWFFIAPGLYKKDNQFILMLLNVFIFTLVGSFYLIYTYLLPQMWLFFLRFYTITDPATLVITLEPNLSDYLKLLFQTGWYMLVLLQYPFCLVFLLRIHFFQFYQFIRFRKLLYIKIFILSALLSPPDLSSQLLIFSWFALGIECVMAGYYFNKQ